MLDPVDLPFLNAHLRSLVLLHELAAHQSKLIAISVSLPQEVLEATKVLNEIG